MGLPLLGSLSLGVKAIAKHMGIECADLTHVDKPLGRMDYLASQIIAKTVQGLSPELQMTYHAARPLIDGYLQQALGTAKIQIPAEVIEMVRRSQLGGTK